MNGSSQEQPILDSGQVGKSIQAYKRDVQFVDNSQLRSNANIILEHNLMQ